MFWLSLKATNLDLGADGTIHIKFDEHKHCEDGKDSVVEVIRCSTHKDEETREREKAMLRELNLQLAQYMAKVKGLMMQSMEKEKQMAMFQEMVVNKKTELFEGQIEELKSQIDAMGREKSQLEEKCCVSQAAVNDLNHQINKWQDNASTKEEKIVTLERDVKNYMAEIEVAKQQLKDKDQQMRDAHAEIDRLRRECEELNKEICRLRSGKQEVEARMERMEANQQSQQQMNQTLIDQIKNEWKRIVGNMPPAECGEKEIKKTMEELREFFDQEYTEAKRSLENKYIKQIGELQTALNSEKAEVRGLKGENSKEKCEKNNLQKRLDKMIAENKELNDKIMSKNCGIVGEVAAKNHQINQLRKEIEQLKNRCSVDTSKSEILIGGELEEYRRLLATGEIKKRRSSSSSSSSSSSDNGPKCGAPRIGNYKTERKSTRMATTFQKKDSKGSQFSTRGTR